MEQRGRRLDLVAFRKLWYALSAATIVLGVIFMVINYQRTGMPLNLGVDFTGGGLIKFQFQNDFPPSRAERIRIIQTTRTETDKLLPVRTQSSVEVEGDNTVAIKTPLKENENNTLASEIRSVLSREFGEKYGEVTVASVETVGPVIGKELRRNAIWAIIFGELLILIYLGFRYDLAFAVCAIVALLHDCLVLVGALAISRMVVNSEFVAVLLTVIGYSVNDTVVIFDRIRENMQLHRSENFPRVVNDSLWQTMTRSINTVLTVLIVLVALHAWGGTAIHSFTFALLVGVTSGAYSSIFNASQLLVSWKGWQAARGRLRGVAPARRLGGRTRTGAAPMADKMTTGSGSAGRSGAGINDKAFGVGGEEADVGEEATAAIVGARREKGKLRRGKKGRGRKI